MRHRTPWTATGFTGNLSEKVWNFEADNLILFSGTKRVRMEGDQIQCYYDGGKYLDVKDSTLDRQEQLEQRNYDDFILGGVCIITCQTDNSLNNYIAGFIIKRSAVQETPS